MEMKQKHSILVRHRVKTETTPNSEPVLWIRNILQKRATRHNQKQINKASQKNETLQH